MRMNGWDAVMESCFLSSFFYGGGGSRVLGTLVFLSKMGFVLFGEGGVLQL
jgi:hypothetical protein